MGGRIMAIDYGLARVGIAITDPLLIIAYPLITVSTKDLYAYLDKYFVCEKVDKIIIGFPECFAHEKTIQNEIKNFYEELKTKYNSKEFEFFNERYTSKISAYILGNSGYKKKKRRKKGNLDKISACVILQSYLQKIDSKKS